MQKTKYLAYLCLLFVSFSVSSQTLTDIDGTLEIRITTPLPDHAMLTNVQPLEYALIVNKDLVYSLKFKDKIPENLTTGSKLHIHQGSFIHATNGDNILNVSNQNITISKNRILHTTTVGRHSALVMLVNFQNQPTTKPWSIDEVNNVVFNTVNHMFNEFSYQQTSIVGDVVGWFTIPINSNAACATITDQVPSLANNAAKKSGINLDNYQYKIYLFPQSAKCDWAGRATVNGSTAWINGLNRSDVIAHELGHNFGLYHADSLQCSSGSIEGTCKRIEYGDYADTMGFPYDYPNAHFNAFQKERLNWLTEATNPNLQTIVSPGTYLIYPFETNAANVKALKILKQTKPNNSQDYYYFEFRQGIGFDSNIGKCADCDFTKGLLVHQGNNRNANSSDLLDMSAAHGNKSKIMALLPGQSFIDYNTAAGGLKVTLNSINEHVAEVNVEFGVTPPPTCIHAAPTLSIEPNTQSMKPGTNVNFTINVNNNDNAFCSNTAFAITVPLISTAITTRLNTSAFTLNPGESIALTLNVATAKVILPMVFKIPVTVTNVNAPQYTGKVTGSVSVKLK